MKAAGKRLLLAYSFAVLAFFYLPILVLMLYSFNDSRINAKWSGWTWKWYLSLFQNEQVLDAFFNSLFVAFVSTVVSTVLGTMAALGLHRYRSRFRAGIDGLFFLPLIVPEIVMGLSLLVLFSQFGIPLGKLTLILAHVTFSISFVTLIVGARLEGMGRHLEEAAQDLGATPWQTFRHVTLPFLAPGILAGALTAFTLSIDDFIISFFVAGPNSTTLPLQIYGMVKRGITPEINALSTILILVTILLVTIAFYLHQKEQTRLPEQGIL